LKLSRSFLAGFLVLLFHAPDSQGQSATVNWNGVDQEIDGFGAASVGVTLTPAQAEFFFSTDSGGIGLSLLRTEVPDDGSCSTINPTCAGQVSDMQLAIANGARVWSTPWSPPASMKSNGSTICHTGSDYGSLNSSSYSSYAAYLANYVRSLSSLYGISLYALSVQNEPDYCPAEYDGAAWTASNFDEFIESNLGPAFATEGLTGTLIMMPETSQWRALTAIASTTMDDPVAASYVSINAWHDYDDVLSAVNPFAYQGKKYWETEASAGPGYGPSLCGGCWDPSIADALMWAQIVNNRMAVANASAWNYWMLIGHYRVNDNEGLIGPDGVTVSKRAYMLGNYSRFVRPGFYRIDATATPQEGVSVSAYKNSTSGALVIVVINQNSSNVSQRFAFNGATASIMTPWITSGSLNLAQQTDISVSGGSFIYNLPAYSITSFVTNVTSSSITPPSRLAAIAQ